LTLREFIRTHRKEIDEAVHKVVLISNHLLIEIYEGG